MNILIENADTLTVPQVDDALAGQEIIVARQIKNKHNYKALVLDIGTGQFKVYDNDKVVDEFSRSFLDCAVWSYNRITL